MAQIQEHVSQKHSPAKILKAGVMGGLGGVIAGGTWGALGTALVAGGGLLIAPALVVGGLLASTGIGISALPSLLAAGAATAIPSNAGLLSQIPTIAAAGAGICGALAAGLFMRLRLKQKELDQTALAQLQAKSSSS